MTAEIREPTADDAEAMGRMHHASWLEAYGDLLPADFWESFRPESRVALWQRLLEHPRPERKVAVALVDGELVGVALAGDATAGEGDAYPPVRDRQLDILYVLAAHQGTGIAQRLLEAVLPASAPAQLWVFENNPRARRFYERNGFAPDGARHVFGPELGGQPEIRLIR